LTEISNPRFGDSTHDFSLNPLREQVNPVAQVLMSGQDYDADLAEQQGKVGSIALSRSLSRTASSARWRTDSPGSLPWASRR
jgi:hypothetical protein